MDSDDDMMSASHSGDELEFDEGTQDSEVGSMAGGVYFVYPLATVADISQILSRRTVVLATTKTTLRTQRNLTKSSSES